LYCFRKEFIKEMLYLILLLAAIADAKIGVGLAGPPSFGSNSLDTAPIYLQSNGNPYISENIPFQFPFPGNTTQDQSWQLQLNVSEALDTSLPGTAQADTNSVLSFIWPNGTGFDSMNKNVNTCALVITNLSSQALAGGQNELGPCVQTLGQSCINNLTAALISSKAYVAGNCAGLSGVIENTCPEIWTDSIAFRKLLPWIWQSGLLTSCVEVSGDVIQNSTLKSGEAFMYSDSGPHIPADIQPLLDAVNTVWPVALITSSEGSLNQAGVSLACLRANSTLAGVETASKGTRTLSGMGRLGCISSALIVAGILLV
jgi:hypothetical protein